MKVKSKVLLWFCVLSLSLGWVYSANIAEAIVGGQEAETFPRQFPFQVALFPRWSLLPVDGLCSGSLISSRSILTAAHCLRMNQVAESTLIVLGAHNISKNETEQIQFRVDSTAYRIHPGFNHLLMRNDIAIVVMPLDITFNGFMSRVRLPTEEDFRNDLLVDVPGTFAGWGRLSSTNSATSDVLQFVTLPIISNQRCSLMFPGSIRSENICVGAAMGKGGCIGDNGAPLVVRRGGDEIQVGVLSFVNMMACGNLWPTVFTRIHPTYTSWINANLV